MKSVRFGSAILAGLVGTLAMTALMYAAPLMGLPKMDLLSALGGLFPSDISPYVVGGLIHLGIGVTLAVLYAVIFDRILPGPRWARGAVFALLPWLFAITLMGPAMAWVEAAVNPPPSAQQVVHPRGAPKPANPCGIQPKAMNPCGAVAPGRANATADAQAPSPWLLRTMSLMAHLVYGGIVGGLYRRSV
jgi:hypothetical protein